MIHKERISRRISEIATKINKDYQNQTLNIICLINISLLIFTSDLIRKIKIPIKFHNFDFSSID